MTNLNINDIARIKLFDLGKRIVEGCLPDLEIQDNDYVEMRIAEIMEIFGAHISYGNNEKHTPFDFNFEIPSIEANFNINYEVEVNLTKKGLLILKEYNQKINDLCKERGIEPFCIEIDDNGYIKMQMGEIMKIFGPTIFSYIDNKELQPFDFNFKVDEKYLEPITSNKRR